MSARPRSICIIGAGAGGLITARTILNQKWAGRVVLLEKRSNVGGVWDYERNGGTKTSAMYHSLRTNLPKEVMQFRDFPFPSDLPSFIPRAAVQRYLEDFADSGKLREYIKFNAEAVKVERIGDGHWRVTWREHHLRDLSGVYDSSFFSEEFSGVCICNGHFNVPHIPEEFRGLPNVVHSKMYDGPEPFEGQNVCIIGTGPSSADIAYEVGMVAKSMTVVGRHHKGEAMVSTRGTLVRGLDRSELLGFDTVLLCTGYEYYFPFLDGIETDVGEHLLELMMWPNDPTLIFIGLPSGVIPFPLMELQAKVYAQFMSGRLSRESLGEFSLINKDSVFKMNVICPELGLPSRAVYWRHLVDLLAGDDYQINLRHWRMCTEINNDVSQYRRDKLPWDPPTYREIQYQIEIKGEELVWSAIKPSSHP